MKWRRKYTVDLEYVANKNKNGYSLVEIGEEVGVPSTTLRNYLRWNGYPVYWSSHRSKVTKLAKAHRKTEYKCVTAWKSALINKYGFQGQVCGYNKIIEAHHIVEKVNGGKSTIENGSLLCPNHHAEAHAGLIDLKALLKRGELLGRPEEVNQQPSAISRSNPRDSEGSETTCKPKGEQARAPRIVDVPWYLHRNDDIVRTADMTVIKKR